MTTVPSHRNIVNIVNQTSMIFLAALAAAIGFRMNLFNIGIEGQYTLASYVAARGRRHGPGSRASSTCCWRWSWPWSSGALWAGIAGVLKVTRGVSEVISTIMLNAIAGTMVGYLLSNHGDQYGQGRRTTPIPDEQPAHRVVPVRDQGRGRSGPSSCSPCWPGSAMSVLINRTRFGFDLRATGMNEPAAVASGVNVKRMVVISMLLSGAIAGLIWMPALFGGADYYGPPFQRTLGFTGIAVALLGRNRPLGIFFGAVLFAWLNEQANPLALIADISPSVVQITQGVVVLAVVIAYEVVRRWSAAAEQRALRSALEEPDSAEVTA